MTAADALALVFIAFALGVLFGVCATLARLGYRAPRRRESRAEPSQE